MMRYDFSKYHAFMRSLIFIVILIPMLLGIFSPLAVGDAIGSFDVDVEIEELPQEVGVFHGNSTSIPFIVKVEGKGNYFGTMNVDLKCTCSHGCVIIEQESISISNGETKRIGATLSHEEILENNDETVTVSAEISNEGNVGPGSGGVDTDNAAIRIVILPENDGSQNIAIDYITIDRILILVIIAFFILISSVVGGLIPYLGKWEKESLTKFTIFGGGVILSLCLFNILPESIKIGGIFAGIGFLLGIPFLFGIERIREFSKRGDADVTTMVMGFNIHEIVEGLLLALAVLILTGAGTLAVWALVAISLHSMPTAFSYISYIRLKKVSEKRTLVYLIIFLLSLPAGIIIGFLILRIVPMALVGFIFGFTGGMLLTLSITEMSPISLKEQKLISPITYYFLAGMVIMGALMIVL